MCVCMCVYTSGLFIDLQKYITLPRVYVSFILKLVN